LDGIVAHNRADDMNDATKRLVTATVLGYAAFVVCLWQAVNRFSDRIWPVTLVAFGPRWLAAVPLIPLTLIVLASIRRRWAQRMIGLLALSGVVLVFGLMDFRLGLDRLPGTPSLRLMTSNVGGSRATEEALDTLMRRERVDVAALQECPFYDRGMKPFGWHFYYGGDLCLVSRFPFTVLDSPDADNEWRTGGRVPQRFEIDSPEGRFQLLNVHLTTIRGGLEGLQEKRWGGLSGFAGNREEAALQSRRARDRVKDATEPLIVAGDFNLPVESAIYLENWARFHNAFSDCGSGFGHSKFTRWFGIRIDHVLMSGQWRCADARVLESPYGGDHVPLVVDLVLLK
jgi:vancomycin resistance protein VanJ